MPANHSGTWEIISTANSEGYMTALGKSVKVNYATFLQGRDRDSSLQELT